MDSKQENEIARRCRAGTSSAYRAAVLCAAHLHCTLAHALELIAESKPRPGDEPIIGEPAEYDVARTMRAGRNAVYLASSIAIENRAHADHVRSLARSMTHERIDQLLGPERRERTLSPVAPIARRATYVALRDPAMPTRCPPVRLISGSV